MVSDRSENDFGVRFLRWPGWDGDEDRSAIEVSGYVQLGMAAVLLCLTWRRTRQPVYLAWAAILTALVLDDSLRLHETTGHAVEAVMAPQTSIGPGLRTQDIGELLFWGCVAIPLGVWWLIKHRAADHRAKRDSWALVLAIAFVATFAVILDVLTIALGSVPVAQDFIGKLILVETGGELLGMSAILLISVVITSRSEGVPHAGRSK